MLISLTRCVRVGLLAGLVLLAACGGGGSGSGASGGEPILLGITVDGVADPLWPPQAGTACLAAVPHNARIFFQFGGALDPANVTAFAATSVLVTEENQGAPLVVRGFFNAQDDPTLPAGNLRHLVFQPDLTMVSAPSLQAGYRANTAHSIQVLAAGQPGAGLIVGPGILRTPAQACFTSCNGGPGSSTCSVDPIPGPPFIEATTPETGNPSPNLLVTPGSTGRISLFCSEPIRGSLLGPTSFVLSRGAGVPVAYQVEVFGPGTPEAGPRGSRIDLVLPSGLAPETEYALEVTGSVQDYGQNVLLLYPPGVSNASRRTFRTGAATYCEAPPIVEDFGSTANLAAGTGVAQWTGDGAARVIYDESIFGNGAFGPLAIASSTILDTGLPPMVTPAGQVAFADGAWNLTTFTVAPGVTARIVGATRTAHFRCLGGISIQGTIQASAGTNPQAELGSPEQGARPGNLNNGGGLTPFVVAGGVGGPGGGGGGRASQADEGTLQIRTPRGETGAGPAVGGAPNAPNLQFFGGGQGGVGGFRFPQGGLQGELGGLGGAGGSARLSGELGAPRGPLSGGCNIFPAPFIVQEVSLPTGAVAAFQPPISTVSAGSGGGGGGDSFSPAPLGGPILQDDQGGGGGGGGGGVRMSAGGGIFISGNVFCNGAPGANGNVNFAGGGGGGSGGQIWIQSSTTLTVSALASLTVSPGAGALICSSHSGGSGGAGIIQFEDADGVVPLSPNLLSSFVAPISFANGLGGTLSSQFLDTGYVAPNYLEASALIVPGNLASATTTLRFQGAGETVLGLPDLGNLSPAVPGSQISQLNGYRFIRFLIEFTYPPPPVSTPTSVLPSIDEIRIRYAIPNCPAMPG